MFTTPTEFYRLDPLTGCNNFLSFMEELARLSASDIKRSYSILHADLNHLKKINQTRGHSYGDSVIRWLEIVLREESNAHTYRIGGDQFSILLTAGTILDHEELSERIFARLAVEGEQLGVQTPAARLALIHYDDDPPYSMHDMIFQMGETMFNVKNRTDRNIHIESARNLLRSQLPNTSPQNEFHTEEVLRWIANDAIGHLFFMGKMLDHAQQASYLDAISGLPNMRAVLMKLEKAIAAEQPFAMLLMDGDNTRAYNNISYACGDDMIRKISAVLSEKLRPGDFLARWRSGDEFMVILPNTTVEGGRLVGERFRSSIEQTSLQWMFPITITTGVAIYPEHGSDVESMVDAAEKALKKGKDLGKNQVVVAE